MRGLIAGSLLAAAALAGCIGTINVNQPTVNANVNVAQGGAPASAPPSAYVGQPITLILGSVAPAATPIVLRPGQSTDTAATFAASPVVVTPSPR